MNYLQVKKSILFANIKSVEKIFSFVFKKNIENFFKVQRGNKGKQKLKQRKNL